MSVIVVNASPRKDWNTAQLLAEAARGAEEAGATVEQINLYDLDFTGCRSCLVCKLKDKERCHCYWKDELSPVIDKIFAADALIVGSPVYFGDLTAGFHALFERLRFVALSYDTHSNYFEGKVDAGFIVTMNVPLEVSDKIYGDRFEKQAKDAACFLNGDARLLAVGNTLQVKDYSKYAMAGFDAAAKEAARENDFPKDLERAYQLGASLVS